MPSSKLTESYSDTKVMHNASPGRCDIEEESDGERGT